MATRLLWPFQSARVATSQRAPLGSLAVDRSRKRGRQLPSYSEGLQLGGGTRLLRAGCLVAVVLLLLQLGLPNTFPKAHGGGLEGSSTPTDMNQEQSEGKGIKPGAPNNKAEKAPSPNSATPAVPPRQVRKNEPVNDRMCFSSFYELLQNTTITRDAREILEQTENLALYMQHHQILPAHLMMVLLEIQGPDAVASCIQKAGGNVYDLKKKVSDILVKLPTTTEVYVVDELEASTQLRQAALRALAIARKDGHATIGFDSLILAVLEIQRMRTLLQEVGTDVEIFLECINSSYKHKVKAGLIAPGGKNKPAGAGPQGDDLDHESAKQFGVDLTELAEQGQISPVFGRNKEIREVVTVLTRKGKGNPCLVGEAGVGKTAVVEGVALRIIEGMTPKPLRDRRLFSVDLGALVAGASHRGEFEARLKKLLKYVLDSHGRVILFIDEVHMLLGAGKSEGPMDAANLLKPAMARGELRIIGATTHEEYKLIEKDAALERRFKPILVEEPPTSQAIIILQRLRPSFEEHHEMKISDEAITAAVLLSEKYIKSRRLPDKAIDLVDEACASKRAQLEMSEDSESEFSMRSETGSTQPKQERSVQRLPHQERHRGTELELNKVEEELERQAEREHTSTTLTATDVAAVVSSWTGIPVGTISEDEKTTILRVAEILEEKIIGQHEASTAVADAMMRSRAGLGEEDAPIGSFLFLGPPGVGKTELAKVLAAEIFHSDKNLIRIDMAEFNEKGSSSKLIGTSPGFVGFEVGGKLTDAVKKRPHSVVLFDEIEKGEPTVLDILLQILQGGRLTDGKNVEVDFTSTVVILTSNVGAQYIVAAYDKAHHGRRTLGHFDPAKESMEAFAQAGEAIPTLGRPSENDEEKGRTFRSGGDAKWKPGIKTKILNEMSASGVLRREIADRLSGVILFEPLSPADIKKIIGIQLKHLEGRLRARNIELVMGDSSTNLIAHQVYSDVSGVRQLKRFIDTYIKTPLSRLLFKEWIAPNMRVLVTASKKYKDSFEAHACSLYNGACILRTRKARILSTVQQPANEPTAAAA